MFRHGKSTHYELIDFLSTNLGKGYKCVAIFLVLAKAFDTVSVYGSSSWVVWYELQMKDSGLYIRLISQSCWTS